jgi:hypothetical protein
MPESSSVVEDLAMSVRRVLFGSRVPRIDIEQRLLLRICDGALEARRSLRLAILKRAQEQLRIREVSADSVQCG